METAFTDAEAVSMFDKLREFARALTAGELAALNQIGYLARLAVEDDVDGFSRSVGGGFASHHGGGPGVHGRDLGITPSPGGPVPIPYPNLAAVLGGFPI